MHHTSARCTPHTDNRNSNGMALTTRHADYSAIKAYIDSKSRSYASTLSVATRKINEMVQTDKWLRTRVRHVHITGRTKSVHSTWRKMQRRE